MRIGVPIPDGDADKLAKAAGCWNTLATGQATANLPAELERAAVLFQEVTAPDVSFIDEDLRELKSSAEDLLTTFADLATACRDQEAAHRKLRADLAAVLTEFAEDIGKEILVTVALSVAASVVGFGMGSAAVAAIRAGKFATKVKHYVDRLRKVMDAVKLKTVVILQKSVPSSRQKLQRIIDLVKKRGDDIAAKIEKPYTPGYRPPEVPGDWVARTADNGKGVVWQKPGSLGNADTIRVMEPTDRYPDGYVRFYNSHGQPVDLNGKPGPKSATHISISPDGSFPKPQGW